MTICQDPRVVLDDPGEILKNCCACDEGKYEVAFEGLWSRYTHPNVNEVHAIFIIIHTLLFIVLDPDLIGSMLDSLKFIKNPIRLI